ncbi:MAG: fibronectin type III domain-containing protein, partial [Desulfamplus sp.]|nr:fibronectin type III domain-containing protein [Desulfamplus sp.]
KKILTSFFPILLLAIPSTLMASANNGYYHKSTSSDFSFYDAMATYGTPAIDGQIGQGEWNTGYSRQIYKYDRDDNRIRYMFKYDTANLYILIEVDDDNIWDDSSGSAWQTNQDDGVEIYIDPDSSRDAFLTQNDRVVAFTVTGKNYRFDRGNNTGSTEYYGEFSGIRKAVGIKGTVNNLSDTDSGYIVETAIPWQHLGGSVPVIGYISLNIIVVEDDDGGPLTIQYDETRWDEPFEIDRYFKWFGDGLTGPSNYARVLLLPSSDTLTPSPVNDITFSAINPFSALISFTSPNDNPAAGQVVKYHIKYSKSGIISTEEAWASATSFHNRFIPKIAGKKETLRITGLDPKTTYHFSVRAEDSHGNLSPLVSPGSAQSNFSFTTPASPSGYGKGKIYPSPSGRFFIHEDGTPFMPVTEPVGITWLGIRDLYDMPLWDDTFKQLINWNESIESGFAKKYIESLSLKGINLVRIFIEDLAFAHSNNPYAPDKGISYLEFPATESGEHYFQETLSFLDDLLNLCADYGIHVTITPFDTYFYKDYWRYNPYNIQNGGMLSSSDQFVTDSRAISSQKKRLKVLHDVVSKHHNFFGWEMMNEWDNHTFASIDSGWEKVRIEWIKDLLGYLRSIDSDTMIFISSVIWQPQFELKDFLLLGDYFDFVCIHNYTKSVKDPTASGDSVSSIRPAWDSKRMIQYVTGNSVDSRPVLDLEFGPISLEEYSSEYTLEDDEDVFHNIIWAEFASGAGGMGLRWPGKTLEYNGPRLSDNMLNYQKNMADFFSQTKIPFQNINSLPFERNIKVVSDKDGNVLSGGNLKMLSEGYLKVFSSSNGESGVVYLLNDKRLSSGNITGNVDATMQISGLENDGDYLIELWNTREQGELITSLSVESESKTLSFPLPDFDRDYFVGFSIDRTSTQTVLVPPILSAVVSGIHMDMSWTMPDGADGVTLYYAPSDLSYIGSLDMGNTTLLSLDLFSGFDYYVALTAYASTGSTSAYSNIERITIP